MKQEKKNYIVVVAAGSGSRYGGDLPKQFCGLCGRPLLMTTLERVHGCAPEAEVLLVLSGGMMGYWRDVCADLGFDGVRVTVVEGGASRAESVRNALRLVDPLTVGWIAVHDGARPMVDGVMFGRLLEGLEGCSGVIPAVAVTDSLRVVEADGSSRSVDRSRLRAVQTPQVFDGVRLLRANEGELLDTFTDDASVMEAAGYCDLRLVDGDPRNIKVTNPGDIAIVEMYLSAEGCGQA